MSAADIGTVREFWNQHPLFVGEASHTPGDRQFFDEHRRCAYADHAGVFSRFFLDVHPGIKALDVGCGIGFWVEELARRGANVHACDLTPRAVELTRERASVFGFPADVRVGNAESLPYADGQFDHVNCQGVIHHTPDTAKCIAEFARVLRPGGTASISVYFKSLVLRSPRLFSLVSALARPLVNVPGRGRDRLLSAPSPEEIVRQYDGLENPIGRAYTREEFRSLLTPHFTSIQLTRFGFPRRFVQVGVPDSIQAVLNRRFGLMILARCRKPE